MRCRRAGWGPGGTEGEVWSRSPSQSEAEEDLTPAELLGPGRNPTAHHGSQQLHGARAQHRSRLRGHGARGTAKRLQTECRRCRSVQGGSLCHRAPPGGPRELTGKAQNLPESANPPATVLTMHVRCVTRASCSAVLSLKRIGQHSLQGGLFRGGRVSTSEGPSRSPGRAGAQLVCVETEGRAGGSSRGEVFAAEPDSGELGAVHGTVTGPQSVLCERQTKAEIPRPWNEGRLDMGRGDHGRVPRGGGRCFSETTHQLGLGGRPQGRPGDRAEG